MTETSRCRTKGRKGNCAIDKIPLSLLFGAECSPGASVLGETDSPGLIAASVRPCPSTGWQPDNTAWGWRSKAFPVAAPVCSGPSSEGWAGPDVTPSQASGYRHPRKGLQVTAAAGRASQCDLGGCPYPSRPARSPTRCGNPGLDGVHSHGSGPLGQWSRPAWGPSSPRRSLPDPGADQQEDGLQVAAVHCGPGRTPPGGEGPGTCPGSEWACSVRCVPELGDPRLLEGQARRAAPPRTTANRKANYFAERAF